MNDIGEASASNVKSDSNKIVKCKMCGCTLEDKSSLIGFRLKSSSEILYFCGSYCESIYFKELELNLRSDGALNRYICCYCDYTTSDNNSFKNHLTLHFKQKDDNFLQHSKEKISDLNVKLAHKSFRCPFCRYRSAQKINFAKHLSAHFTVKKTLFCCPHCCFKSYENAKIKSHLAQHFACFPCPHCNFKSSLKGNLKQHLLRHTGVKPFKCHLCDFKSAQNVCLKRHQLLRHSSTAEVNKDK